MFTHRKHNICGFFKHNKHDHIACIFLPLLSSLSSRGDFQGSLQKLCEVIREQMLCPQDHERTLWAPSTLLPGKGISSYLWALNTLGDSAQGVSGAGQLPPTTSQGPARMAWANHCTFYIPPPDLREHSQEELCSQDSAQDFGALGNLSTLSRQGSGLSVWTTRWGGNCKGSRIRGWRMS